MSELTTKPSIDEVWDILDTIPDPEIPVISLVDLGVIRDVVWHGDKLVIAVAPTYSGCPASAVINLDIETALRARGVTQLDLRRYLTQPWTTDWMSASAHKKLRAYGIAPPVSGSHCKDGLGRNVTGGKPPDILCPRCNSSNTRRVSQFGSTPCKASYACNDCLEPFDYFKCI